VTAPILGIDASTYQGPRGMSFARFEALHAAGVRFGIFRATINATVDASCKVNLARADKLGWAVGSYHFLYPGNADTQAELYAKHCGDGLAVLDVEQSGVTRRDVKDFVRRFRELRPKRPLGCYTSEGAWGHLTGNADGADLFDYLWQARWTQLGTNERSDLPAAPPRAGFGGWRTAELWQYGAFRVKGYPAIDGNAWYGTLAELRALGTVPRPPLEERPRYREAYAAMLEAAEGAVTLVADPVGTGPAWAKGVADARHDAILALGALHVVEP